jgi:hypothetical protein
VKRLAAQPFALIGINSDGGQAALQRILKQQGITWRQAVDVTTDGPIGKNWNIHGWPMLFILDSKGVIRFMSIGDDGEIEKNVDKLLDEMQPKKSPSANRGKRGSHGNHL